MATDKKQVEIPGRLHSVATEGVVAGANEILDDNKGKNQQEINASVDDSLQENKTNIANEITRATNAENAIKGGSSKSIQNLDSRLSTVEAHDTISMDGGSVVVGTAEDFTNRTTAGDAKIPTVGAILNGVDEEPTAGSGRLVKSGGVQNELALGAVYDVSAKNPTAGTNNDGKFESLSALLSDANINTLIPIAVRKGGMSIKFVQSSDNKYVQARCMAQNFTTNVTQWQGVDDTPTAGSKNLVESGGVDAAIQTTSKYLRTTGKGNVIHYGFPVRGFKAGAVYKFSILNVNELKDKITAGNYGSVNVFAIKAYTKDGDDINVVLKSISCITESVYAVLPSTVNNIDVEELRLSLGVRVESGYDVLVSAEEQTSFIGNRDYNIFTGTTGTFFPSDQTAEKLFLPTYNGSFYKITNKSGINTRFILRNFSNSVGVNTLIGAGKSVIVHQSLDCDYIETFSSNIDFEIEKLSISDNIIDGSLLLYEQGFYNASTFVKTYGNTVIRTKYPIEAKNDNFILTLPTGYIIRYLYLCDANGNITSSTEVNSQVCELSKGLYHFTVKNNSDGVITPSNINPNLGAHTLDFLSNKAVDFIKKRFSFSIASSNTMPSFNTYKDNYYVIWNKGNSAFTFSTKDLNNTDGVSLAVPAENCALFKQTLDCNLIKSSINNASFEIASIDIDSEVVIDGTTLLYEQGYYSFINKPTNSDTLIRTKNYIYIPTPYAVVTVPDEFKIARVLHYDTQKKFIGTESNDASFILLAKGYHTINVGKKDNSVIRPFEVMRNSGILQEIGGNNPIHAAFNFDTGLLDVTQELAGMDFFAVDSIGCYTFQDQIYAKWDALMAAYPNLIEKVDLGVYTNESYPVYARLNGEAQGNYEATPSYNVYMYKVSMPTKSFLHIDDAARRKVFILAGLHGWENASQFNTYVVASMLCKVASNDYYVLGSLYDFYFVPCANGYGAYHSANKAKARTNADGIDINRNFPHPNWKVQGQPGDYDYSGESAASEFETKIICKAVAMIKPDIFIDHHSYSPTTYNFYAEATSLKERIIMFQNLYAWNYRACKEYPEYYGTNYTIRPNVSLYELETGQTSKGWAHNVGVASSLLTEVCLGIGFRNGQPNYDDTSTLYKEPIVKLNELMLRLMLLRFAEYQLKNGLRTSDLDSNLLVE